MASLWLRKGERKTFAFVSQIKDSGFSSDLISFFHCSHFQNKIPECSRTRILHCGVAVEIRPARGWLLAGHRVSGGAWTPPPPPTDAL
jgi:hypothetical protein